MENDKLYRSLVSLLKIFKNRPNHLAKYLVENDAFTNDFIYKLENSDKLKKLIDDESDSMYFTDISKMDKFYNSLIDDIKKMPKSKSILYITNELNGKLDLLIKEEKYEEAASMRDYMSRNNIKRISNKK